VPGVASGFTDSHFFREIGIASYGYMPALLPPDEIRGIHGNNERISIANMHRGSQSLYELLKLLTAD
jgi:acetylornithine deacetylase/succinyl-diaminopimelate desuccinylase-like protein